MEIWGGLIGAVLVCCSLSVGDEELGSRRKSDSWFCYPGWCLERSPREALSGSTAVELGLPVRKSVVRRQRLEL
jgi:hypothetical protein